MLVVGVVVVGVCFGGLVGRVDCVVGDVAVVVAVIVVVGAGVGDVVVAVGVCFGVV